MLNKVLIIENREDIYLSICEIFNSLDGRNFDYEWQKKIEDGLEQIASCVYDYCLIGNQLLSLHNDYLFQKISSLSNDILVIVYSGFDDDLVNINVFESKSCEHLIKGKFSKEALSNTIRYAVKNHEIHTMIQSKTDKFNAEGNFAALANTNLDGLLVLDENGTVLYGNPAAGDLYDCPGEELAGKQLGIPITSDKATVLDLIRKDGNVCIVEARFTNIDWTNQRAYLVSLRDITEQERTLSVLRQASIYDDLTGLYNRREANRFLQEEIARCKRYNQISSVLMFDIDNFKMTNDSIGHFAGDAALRWIGQIINEQIRSIDKVARFGGDEFIILFPAISGSLALIAAERICRTIANQPCQITIDHDKHEFLPLSISIGIAEIPTDGGSLDLILKVVDRALYKAKDLGGNQAVLYKSSTISEDRKGVS